MKRCQIDCDLIENFDLFGKQPEFFYKGKSQRVSWFGRIFSVFYIVLYVAFVIYKLVRMLKKVDIDFYETYAFSGIPSIKLNNDLFYGGFTIGGLIDETLYFPVVYHYTETTVNGVRESLPPEPVALTQCSLDMFGKRFQPLFADRQLDNLYCMEDVHETLAGYSNLDEYSYYYIMIMPCIGYNLRGELCQPLENVTAFFQQTHLEFKMQDIVMTPKDYDNPSIARNMDIKGPVFSFLYQSIYTYMQIVNLETDQDWLGFEALSDIKKEQFLRYDESWIIAAPSPHMYGLKAMTPVCDITIQLSAKVLTTKRANTKLIEVLGDVGGLMEVVWSAFNILSIFITDLLYDIDIVNSLFSFDLSKKTVKIKKDSKDNYDLSDVDEINIYNAKKSKNTHTIKFSAQIKEKEENTETPAVEQIKTKKKKKIKSKRTIASSNNANDEKNSYNHNMNFNTNENKKVNEVEKQTIMSNNLMASHENLNELKKTVEAKNSEIFEEIKINKFFIVFAFCCIRKRKNINNYVLDEGLNLIGKRLDVFNIFKRLYYDEKVQRSYMIGEEEFAMSEECKEKLS
jgi:hypothetical protein